MLLLVITSYHAVPVLTCVHQLLTLKTCRMYNVFGSGANHAIYAQFIAQTSAANNGRKIGLLRGAGTRMASWFYGMMRLLRLKQPLKATIHQQQFRDLTLNGSAKAAVHDIEDDKFWKCLYVLLRAVYPALRALRYCDSNSPVMDKIYFLSHRTTEAIKQSQDFFNEVGLFSTDGLEDMDLASEMNQVFEDVIGDTTPYAALNRSDNNNNNSDDDNDNNDNDSDNNEEEEEEEEEGEGGSDDAGEYGGFLFGSKILWHWEHRKIKIEHEYAITAWALCVMDDVREDVRVRLIGEHRLAMEKVIKRLHLPPCPNQHPEVMSMTEAQIVDVFWDEFKAFRNCTPPFDEKSCWATPNITAGRSHLWHEKNFFAVHKSIGFCGVPCDIKVRRNWSSREELGGRETN